MLNRLLMVVDLTAANVNGDEIICANDTHYASSLCYGDSGGKIKIKTWFFLILLMENKFLAIIF